MSLHSKFAGQGQVGRTMRRRNPGMREAHYRQDGQVIGTGKVAKTQDTFVLGSDRGTMFPKDSSVKHSSHVPMKKPGVRRPIIIKSPGNMNKKFTLPSGKFGRVENSRFSTRKVGVNDDIMTPNLARQDRMPKSKSKPGGSGRMKVGR